ncbi:MAG: TonB-like protein [Acidobacteriales bacterium]|nr:TonB-like protein [Terriglobales bacterium]
MKRFTNCLRVLMVLLALSNAQSAFGFKNKDIEAQLRSSLQDKMFLLRGLPTDKKLIYDSQFKLLSEIHPGPWYAAQIEVHKIRVKEKEIKIDGECLGYVENGIKPGRNIEISITGPFTQDSTQLLTLIRDRVFVMNQDELNTLVPKPWQELFGSVTRKKTPGGIAGILPNGEMIYRFGQGMKTPKPIKTPDPEYSEEARKSKYQGTSVLGIIVDRNGRVIEVHVATPAGHGLDEKAVEAVRQWTFEPAILDGKPVAMMLNVEVSFHLY